MLEEPPIRGIKVEVTYACNAMAMLSGTVDSIVMELSRRGIESNFDFNVGYDMTPPNATFLHEGDRMFFTGTHPTFLVKLPYTVLRY